MRETVYINCDGGARGNPGPAAAAFVVKKGGEILFRHAYTLGETTNNVAEYKAVIAALKWARQNTEKLSGNNIIFFLDSELVTKQLLGIYKTKNIVLRKLLETAKLLEQNLQNKISFKLIPREKNKEADYLVNKILDNS